MKLTTFAALALLLGAAVSYETKLIIKRQEVAANGDNAEEVVAKPDNAEEVVAEPDNAKETTF